MASRSFRDELLDFTEENRLADKRVKPALLALLSDQADLIVAPDGSDEYGIRDGFPNRRELLVWYQRAIVRSLGHIDEYWSPEDCVEDAKLVSATTGGDVGYRRVLESVAVQPAFRDAYRDMKRQAKDYVQRPDQDDKTPTGKDLDPSDQAYLAMRPGFQVIDEQQHRALDELWGGFEDVDQIQDWLHALNAPTNGEIDGSMAEEFVTDDVALERLVFDRDAERSRQYREALAATVILPAFVAGVRSMEAEELAKETGGMPTTFRMKGGN